LFGDARFEQRAPAQIAALGDPDNVFPTYADQHIDVRPGAPITACFNLDGVLSSCDACCQRSPDTGRGRRERMRHPQCVSALHQRGQRTPAVALHLRPISGAAWTRIGGNGVERAVVFQVFERRVLTSTPDNPLAFRVETGNVGQHDYR
jgi:hypothetical protein